MAQNHFRVVEYLRLFSVMSFLKTQTSIERWRVVRKDILGGQVQPLHPHQPQIKAAMARPKTLLSGRIFEFIQCHVFENSNLH